MKIRFQKTSIVGKLSLLLVGTIAVSGDALASYSCRCVRHTDHWCDNELIFEFSSVVHLQLDPHSRCGGWEGITDVYPHSWERNNDNLAGDYECRTWGSGDFEVVDHYYSCVKVKDE